MAIYMLEPAELVQADVSKRVILDRLIGHMTLSAN